MHADRSASASLNLCAHVVELCKKAVDFQHWQPLGILTQSLQTIKLHSNHRLVADEHVLAAAAAAAALQYAVAAAAAVYDAVIDHTVQTSNCTKCFKLAAVAVTASGSDTSSAPWRKTDGDCYLLQSV
jgi:hypothetical protein